MAVPVEPSRIPDLAGMPSMPWRIRNVPNAVARNGAVNPWKLLNQRRLRIVSTLPISVTSSGSINVAMNNAKMRRLNGNRKYTKAYAASTDVNT